MNMSELLPSLTKIIDWCCSDSGKLHRIWQEWRSQGPILEHQGCRSVTLHIQDRHGTGNYLHHRLKFAISLYSHTKLYMPPTFLDLSLPWVGHRDWPTQLDNNGILFLQEFPLRSISARCRHNMASAAARRSYNEYLFIVLVPVQNCPYDKRSLLHLAYLFCKFQLLKVGLIPQHSRVL